MSNTIYVYENFSSEEPVLLGRLYVEISRGAEHHSFEFEKEWLRGHRNAFILDPDLLPVQGRQYSTGQKMTFGIFSDASPDRWGRVLMDRRERFAADKEGRKPRKLNAGDYLLGVYDETRMGAIRFKADPDGAFLSDDKETAAPPWATLRTLEEASRNFESEKVRAAL